VAGGALVVVRLVAILVLVLLAELLAELLSELLELSEELELVLDDLALVVALAEELTVDDPLAVSLVAEETPEPPVTAKRPVKFISLPWLISSA